MDLLALIPPLATELLLCISMYIRPCLCHGAETWVRAHGQFGGTQQILQEGHENASRTSDRKTSAGVLALLGVLTNTARIHQTN